MEQANIALSVAAFALGVVGCGGSSDVRMRPSVPSDVTTVTTTTGASTPATSPATAANALPVGISQPSPSPLEDALAPGTIDKSVPLAAGPTPRSAPAWGDASRKTRHAEASFTDAEIVAVLESADRAERQLARETLKRAQSPSLRQLAQRVLSDHGEAKLERLERRSSLMPADNTTSAELTAKGAQSVQALQSSSGRDFDQTSIAALVGEERQVVQLLDERLIPQAQNAELRTLLQDARTSVSSRLGMARELQSAPNSR